jgi:fibronectin-binding autotransporter adhesin
MAVKYWVGGTDTWNTVAGSKWSLISGGTTYTTIPAVGDDVYFDSASGSGTVTIGAGATATNIFFTHPITGNYAGTLNIATNMTVVNSFTLSPALGFSVTGTGTLIRSGSSGTLTSNGKIWSGSLQTSSIGGATTTFGDNWTINGSMLGTIAQVNITAAAARIITINGSLTTNNNYTCTNITFVLNGTGVSSTLSGGITTAIINISPTAIITQAGLTLTNCIFSIVAPFTGTFTSTGGVSFGGVSNTLNNVSSITFLSMAFLATGGQQLILNSNANTGNLSVNGGAAGAINGLFTLSVSGNLIPANGLTGTSTIQMVGSSNATISTGTIVNNLTINKSGVATVTFTASNTWGAANRTLTFNSNAIFTIGTTLTLSGSPLTIVNNSTPVTQFVNMSIPANTTLNINGATTPISGTLLLTGGATFGGTHGFITQNFTNTVPGSAITFQNIVANPNAEYIVNGVLTLIGTLANRITLQAAGSATFNGTINPVGQLNYLSGTIPSIGMTLSQNTGVSPVGLIGLLPNRPVITGGTSPTFTITPSATAIIGTSFSMRAGYKAKFTLTNGTGSQNVAYTTTQDIDSNSGATITSFGSNGDDINNTTISLFRTLNWGPLIAPSGSVYYTFVN